MERARWASRTVFVLAAVGSAVGLGNVWRFPYLAGKYGGGVFLVPYLLALFVVGVPVLMMEFAIGQKMQQGAIGSFTKLHPSWGGLGVLALLSSFIIVCYYAVVMAWSLIYFWASFGVPWAQDPQDYFFTHVLQITESVDTIGGINWPICLSLLIVWVLIYFCVWRGVRSVGKVVWLTVPMPVFLLVILLIRAITLPGFLDGWAFYLTPVWSALLDAEVWIAAFSQIFFTLTLGFGVMVAYASHKESRDDVAKDTWVTALINSGISLFAGFVVFGILGYMATSTHTQVAELAASGPGLAFVVFPEALSLMPVPWFFSAVFFLTLLLLGIDSAFSVVEAVTITILDTTQRWTSNTLSLLICGSACLAGVIFTTRAGLYFLDIVDHFVTNYNLIIVGILQAILAGWLYGAEKLRRYINEVSDWRVGRWWNRAIQWSVPVVLATLLVNQFWNELQEPYEGYPAWALMIGWGMVLLPCLVFFTLLCTSRGRIRARGEDASPRTSPGRR